MSGDTHKDSETPMLDIWNMPSHVRCVFFVVIMRNSFQQYIFNYENDDIDANL